MKKFIVFSALLLTGFSHFETSRGQAAGPKDSVSSTASEDTEEFVRKFVTESLIKRNLDSALSKMESVGLLEKTNDRDKDAIAEENLSNEIDDFRQDCEMIMNALPKVNPIGFVIKDVEQIPAEKSLFPSGAVAYRVNILFDPDSGRYLQIITPPVVTINGEKRFISRFLQPLRFDP